MFPPGNGEDMPAFVAQNLCKSYKKGKKQVLHSVELEADHSECIGIVGANGSGKTTLLSILAGVRMADTGTVLYKDIPLFGQMFRQAVAYVPQENPLIEELSVRDNLKLWYGDRLRNLDQEPGEIFGILGVMDFIDERVSNLSGGMKKRLSISCAVAGNQPVLLLDEPGASLDIPCKERICDYIENRKRQGASVIIATHEEREINMCDRLYLLTEGRLEQLDHVGDIRSIVDRIV